MTRPRGAPSTARVLVGSGRERYPVFIGPGLLGRLVRDVAAGRAGRLTARPASAAIIADARVGRLYGRALAGRLGDAGIPTDLLVFPAGERSKTRERKASLENRLASLRFGRDGLVVALGGGVAGDLGGFVAATWHRGVSLIHAPTTAIAMLDASIGGKVGVDHPLGKNLVGAFHPPAAVYADTSTLRTLPDRELVSGWAEAVKCGAIADRALFAAIERSRSALRRRAPSAVRRTIQLAARFKGRVVSSDEREQGPRMLLNFGHTIGHALEAVRGYGMLHGEAVAIGVALESRLAVQLGLLDDASLGRIERLLRGLGLPVLPSPPLRPKEIAAMLVATSRDKKVRAGIARYVLPARIGGHAGGSRYAIPVPDRDVERVLLNAAFERSEISGT